MIGQRDLLRKINHQIDNGKFPRFSILIGERGCGKKTLANEIAQRLDAFPCFVGNKVDDIRQVIDNSYKNDLKIVYIIADADNMSSNAENAILKITEEPPKNAYFIITCELADNLLPTIKSRGVTYMLEPYSYEEKCDFLATIEVSDENFDFLVDSCSNIGEMQELLKINITEFREYVNLVVENIAEVSGSNAFKIGDKIALKDEEDKYNLRLFLKAFNIICTDKMHESSGEVAQLQYGRAVAITGDALSELSIKGINKTMLFDTWLLKIRSEWL